MPKTNMLVLLVVGAMSLALAGCRESALSDAWRTGGSSPQGDTSRVGEDDSRADEGLRAEIAEVEESLADAEAETAAAREELAALKAQMAEQEARAAEREAKLEKALALEAERAKVAAQRAEVREAEQRLAEQARELEERERTLEAREFDVTVREDALEEARSEAVGEGREHEANVGAPTRGPEAPSTATAPRPAERRQTTAASLAPGKVLEVEVLETLSSRTHRVGDTFKARLVQDLRNEDGVLVIPAGAPIRGEVVHVVPLKKVGGRAELGIEFTHVEVSPGQTVRIRASLDEFGKDKRKDRKKILIATAAGAILGRVLGGDTQGAVAGAAVGAAASTAVAASAEGKDAEIPSGEILALQLEEVVTVEVEMTGTADDWRLE